MHERRSVAATMLSLSLSIFYLCGNNMALCSALTLHWQRAWANVTSTAMLYRYIFIIHTIYCMFAGNSQSVGIYKSYPPTNEMYIVALVGLSIQKQRPLHGDGLYSLCVVFHLFHRLVDVVVVVFITSFISFPFLIARALLTMQQHSTQTIFG